MEDYHDPVFCFETESLNGLLRKQV